MKRVSLFLVAVMAIFQLTHKHFRMADLKIAGSNTPAKKEPIGILLKVTSLKPLINFMTYLQKMV